MSNRQGSSNSEVSVICLLEMQFLPNSTRMHVIPCLSHNITVPIATALKHFSMSQVCCFSIDLPLK